jgi:CrcB protein
MDRGRLIVLVLLVALGGAIGAVARFGVSGLVESWTTASFPWGTLVVNALGSLALGFFLGVVQTASVQPRMRAFVAVGVLGAFTTFSTFSFETVALIQEGQWGRASLYAMGSLALGLAGIFAGLALASARVGA